MVLVLLPGDAVEELDCARCRTNPAASGIPGGMIASQLEFQ